MIHLSNKLLRWIFFIHIFLFLFVIPASAQVNQKKVLILNSYHKGFPWTDNIVQGIESILGSEENDTDLTIEYMDTKSQGFSEDYQQVLYELYSHKYRDKRFDLIVSSDDNAFDFLREYGEQLFPGAPFVFCGVNNRNAPNMVDPTRSTGVLESTAHEQTIDLILKLHPKTKNIYLVVDTTPSGDYRWGVVSPSFSQYPAINFIRLSDENTIGEIEDIVGDLGEESAIIFFTLYRDKTGKYISVKEGVTRITKASARPVYTTHRLELDYGAVGGKVLGGFYHGEFTAGLALRILNGEAVSSIPVVKRSPTRYVFNYDQLEKWNIPLSALPDDSTVLNRPVSLFEENKLLVWIALAVIISMGCIIFFLQKNTIKRKRAEKLLMVRNNDLRLAQSIAKVGNWTLNPEVGVPEWSDEIYRIYERDPEMGPCALADYEKIYKGEWFEKFNSAIQGAIHEGQPYDIELKLEFDSDNIKWVHALCEPERKEGSEKYFLRGTIQDITKIRKIEEKLRSSETQYRDLVEETPDLVTRVDNEGYILFVNHASITFYGLQPEDCIGRLAFDFIHPEDHASTTESFNEWLQSEGSSFTHENRLVGIDGQETHYVSWTIRRDTNEDGSVAGFSGVARDVTGQKLAATEMEQQKATLESLFESIPDALTLVNNDGHIVAINKSFTGLFGYTLDEVSDRPVSLCYESKKELLRHGRLRSGLSSEQATEPLIINFRKKDGSIFSGETVSKKVFTADGKVLGAVGLTRDVTDKLRQEELHRQTQKMEAIGILSGGIAHDFNNLLAIIGSNIDIFQHKQKTGDITEENIGNIKEAVGRAKNLVSQILAFSRQEKHDLSPVNISEAISGSLKLLRSIIPTSVEFLIELEHGDATVFVNADTTQLQQVLINLCTNAVHAMDEKGTLSVKLRKVEPVSQDIPDGLGQQPGGYARISVSDTGCGIEEKDIDRIFDPFFTTKDIGVGTGMGLSAAYGIVDQHGGKMTVDSTPDQGTTFHIYLPIITAHQKEPKVEIEETLPTGTERILFVDDEECLAESCSELLECKGYTVTSFTSSREALELFKINPEDFDLIITDQTMPGLTGVELAEVALKIRPDIPIVLCSGYAAKVSEDVAKGIGIREFCMKPMDIRQLATVTRKVLDENDLSS